MRIQIVRTGESSNITSVVRALQFLDLEVKVCETAGSISRRQPLLLPGVGTFNRAMLTLESSGMADAIRDHSGQQAPLVGICLGMQVLCDNGEEEGFSPGLSLINGSALSFGSQTHSGMGLHIGFRPVRTVHNSSHLANQSRYYFSHSYFLSGVLPSEVVATSNFAGLDFPAQISKGGVSGFQYHPELSGIRGVNILKSAVLAPE